MSNVKSHFYLPVQKSKPLQETRFPQSIVQIYRLISTFEARILSCDCLEQLTFTYRENISHPQTNRFYQLQNFATPANFVQQLLKYVLISLSVGPHFLILFPKSRHALTVTCAGAWFILLISHSNTSSATLTNRQHLKCCFARWRISTISPLA